MWQVAVIRGVPTTQARLTSPSIISWDHNGSCELSCRGISKCASTSKQARLDHLTSFLSAIFLFVTIHRHS